MLSMRKLLQRRSAAGRSRAAVWLAVLAVFAVLAALGYAVVESYLPESGPFAGAEIDPASLAPETDEAQAP